MHLPEYLELLVDNLLFTVYHFIVYWKLEKLAKKLESALISKMK